MKSTLAIAALTLAGVATPSMAQAPSDATCVLVSNLFAARSTDAAQKKVAENSLYYYFGRVDTHLSGTALQSALRQAGASINMQNAGPTMTTCARNMQARAAAFQGSTVALQVQPKKK